jgi:hypothetical protein
MNAAAYASPRAWTGGLPRRVFPDYSGAMGQYLAAGQSRTGGSTDSYTSYIANARAYLTAFNADIAALHLPAAEPSISSPNA